MKMNDSQTMILVHARAADTLTALTERLSVSYNTVFCSSVYEVFTALSRRPDMPAILVTRPSMLVKPDLPETLQRFPKLHIIGYLAPGEQAPLTGLSITTVADADALAAALETAVGTGASQPQYTPPAGPLKLDLADYRLTDDERNALLGARS